MKLVVAVIKPFKLEEVKAALEGVGVQGLTVTDARGFGRQRGHTEVYRGAEYQVELLPKTRVEVLADDDAVEDVVKAIVDGARTGSIGDGKVFILPVEEDARYEAGRLGVPVVVEDVRRRPAAERDALLADPGFETGLDGWRAVGAVALSAVQVIPPPALGAAGWTCWSSLLTPVLISSMPAASRRRW